MRAVILLMTLAVRMMGSAYSSSPPADVTICGLFPMFRLDGSFDTGGARRLSAFLLAVEQANKDPELLPNTRVNVTIFDSRRNAGEAINGAVKCLDHDSVAVVGAASSGPTMMANRVLSVKTIPQISYSATSPTLSDNATYKGFFRTPPSDAAQSQLIARAIHDVLGAAEAVAIAGPDAYSTSGIEAFISASAAFGITVTETIQLSPYTSVKVAQKAVARLKRTGCSIAVVFAQASELVALFQAVVDADLHRMTWFMSELILGSIDDVRNAVDQLDLYLSGSLVVAPGNGDGLPAFAELTRSLKSMPSTRRGEWCSDAKDDYGRFIWRQEGTGVCGGLNMSEFTVSQYVPYSYDATNAVIQALHTLHYGNSSNSRNLAEAIFSSRHVGVTGKVLFTETGDRVGESIKWKLYEHDGKDFVSVGGFDPALNAFVGTHSRENASTSNLPMTAASLRKHECKVPEAPREIADLTLLLGIVAATTAGLLLALYHVCKLQYHSHRRRHMEKQKEKPLRKQRVALATELRNKLIYEVALLAASFLLDIVDILTDWMSYAEENFSSTSSLTYFIYTLSLTLASACSAFTVFMRLATLREVLLQHKNGITVLSHATDDEMKDALFAMKIHPPEFLAQLLSRKRKYSAYILLGAFAEDIPQLIFNLMKDYTESTVFLASIAFSLLSCGYKLAVPYLLSGLAKLTKQVKVMREEVLVMEKNEARKNGDSSVDIVIKKNATVPVPVHHLESEYVQNH